MKITLLVDNHKSWILPFVKKLQQKLEKNHKVDFVTDYKNISKGDVVFFLACRKIVPPEILKRNRHNLVIHESRLPKGKGMSPLTWQILDGKNTIPITLFEAAEKVDSGKIYLQDYIKFEGHELVNDLRRAQGNKTIKLAKKFVDNFGKTKGKKQVGKSSFYPRRTLKDSQLDINKSIKSQFNLLRVVDNKRYPAYFNYQGFDYILKVYKRKPK